MRRVLVSIVVLVLIGFSAGCSKKKEEAAKLQAEMLAQDSAKLAAVADSIAKHKADSIDQSMAMDAEAIPEETGSAAMPPRPSGSGYTVQVAGCESGDYAQFLVQRYIDRGYDPYVESVVVEGQQYYRVRIGILGSLAEAQSLQAELQDKYSLSTWIDIIE